MAAEPRTHGRHQRRRRWCRLARGPRRAGHRRQPTEQPRRRDRHLLGGRGRGGVGLPMVRPHGIAHPSDRVRRAWSNPPRCSCEGVAVAVGGACGRPGGGRPHRRSGRWERDRREPGGPRARSCPSPVSRGRTCAVTTCPNLEAFVSDAAVGDLSTRIGRRRASTTDAYLSIGAGTRSLAPTVDVAVALDPDETYAGVRTADILERRLGRVPSGVAYLAVGAAIDLNERAILRRRAGTPRRSACGGRRQPGGHCQRRRRGGVCERRAAAGRCLRSRGCDRPDGFGRDRAGGYRRPRPPRGRPRRTLRQAARPGRGPPRLRHRVAAGWSRRWSWWRRRI